MTDLIALARFIIERGHDEIDRLITLMEKREGITEAQIQEAYDLCDAGEITFEERHQRLGWLQNHAAVLRHRLGLKD